MNNTKKRNVLNRMNPAAQAAKLGNEIVFTVTKKLAAADISAGVATVDTGFDYQVICGVFVTAADGSIRTATKAVKDGIKVKLTVTSVAANDTVTVLVK